VIPPDGPREPDDAWVGPDVRPVIEPEPESLLDPHDVIDPVTGLRVHSLQPRRPRTRGGLVYLGVLAVAIGGFVLVMLGQWRPGTSLLGITFLLATIGRMALPDRDAGMLKLRRKAIDVPTLLAIGLALIVLASVVPDAPTP
jgi:hypothetical protein